jgi:hypothetical protein
MSYPTDDTGFYHLTRSGWVRHDHRPFPPDRVETWSYRAECPADDAKEQVCLVRVWKDDRLPASMGEMLHRRFGFPVMPQPDRNITIECET